MSSTILVTGGAGFIGSNFVLQQMQGESASIVNLDKLTYAGNLHNLESLASAARYEFVRGRYRRPRVGSATTGKASPGRDRALRGGESCRPLDPGARGFHSDEYRRDICIAGRNPGILEHASRSRAKDVSASCTFPPTKFTARLGRMIRRSARPLHIARTVHMPRRKRRPIIWCAPITIPTDCQRLRQIVRTTTGDFSSPKN